MVRSLTVQICDDHAVVRSTLRRLLESEPELTVVGEATSAAEAIAAVGVLRPDVLLLDIAMPGLGGMEALPEIVRAAPETRVLMLSMHDDPAYVDRAFGAGAAGYLVKGAADTELVHAIREVAEGRRYVQSLLAARLSSDEVKHDQVPHPDPLSEREAEVLRLLALGHTNQEIANLLRVSVRTAETHRARIVRKLGFRTRAELVRYALQAGALRADQGVTARPSRNLAPR